ncbi:MAG: hypothetical protein IJ060_05425 [Oscillospiraceae bacterium]|nr:hypothetical protein [Oscillospiraceae bacterium]
MRMDKNRYRDAVSGIRWTDAQRGKIEEKLRQPAEKPSGAAFEDEDFETYEPPMTTEERRRMEEEMAKQERKLRRMGRMGWAVAAALLIVIGGGVTAAVIHTKKLQQESLHSPESKLGLHLTDQKDSASQGLFARSENGYYILYSGYEYNMGTYTIRNEEGELTEVDAISQTGGRGYPTFYDPETGESAILCARPNCTHDGSTYCTATTKAYSSYYRSDRFPMVYADGYLYTVSTKHSKWTETDYGYEQADPKEDHAVLLRYEPDGSGITELHDFGTGTGGFRPTMHRGYLWFAVQTMSYGETVQNPISGADEAFVNGGYEIWGYELKTGNLVKIYDSESKPDINHVDTAPQYLAGIGDYIYFNTEDGDWASPTGTNRINLLTGEMTQAPDVSLENGFNDNYGLYYDSNMKDYSSSGSWMLVNLETGEAKPLANTQHSTEFAGMPFLSGDYIYWCQFDQGDITTLRIYDLNAETLLDQDVKEFHLPEYPSEWGDVLQVHASLAEVSDGRVYLYRTADLINDKKGIWWSLDRSVYSCAVEELIAGNPEWTKEFELMDSEEAGKKYNELISYAEEHNISSFSQ